MHIKLQKNYFESECFNLMLKKKNPTTSTKF